MQKGASNHSTRSTRWARRARVSGSPSLVSLAFLTSRTRLAILLRCGDREAHRAHQTHLVDLFSHVDFHFVSAGLPRALRRGEREIAAVVFKRDVHRILSDLHRGIEAGDRFREATPEHLESLIMLVEMEYDEDGLGIGTKPVGRFDRHYLVGTVKTQFLVESFRCRNRAKQTLRRSVEVVGDDVLGAVL